VSSPDPLPVIILGGGGHARVLVDCLRLSGRQVYGFTAPQPLPDLAPATTAWSANTPPHPYSWSTALDP